MIELLVLHNFRVKRYIHWHKNNLAWLCVHKFVEMENVKGFTLKYDCFRFWDIFNNIPREKKSKDVHERSSLRVIKFIIYGLIFLLVFCSLVVQKISLMLLVNYGNYSGNGTDSDKQVSTIIYRSIGYIFCPFCNSKSSMGSWYW